MDFLAQLLAQTGPIGVGITVIFVLMLLGIKILWETQRDERKARVEAEIRNNEKYENVVKQMFEVVNANTKALTSHTEVSKELKESFRELRLKVDPS